MEVIRPLLFLSAILFLAPCKSRSTPSAALDWQSYQNSICLNIFRGEIVLPALGHGRICGHPTPNCNQAYCHACAVEKGVCEVCGKKNDWTKNTDPETEVPLLFAILEHSPDREARRVAIYALGQIKKAGTLERLMKKYGRDRMLSLQLAAAIGEFKDERYLSYLKMVLHRAGNSYFGDDHGDSDTQYYIESAARAAAFSLAQIGSKQAVDILLSSARCGRLWERYYALEVLGMIDEPRVKDVLIECLKEFFAKDRDWKWIPGRNLIGAALKSLGMIGDEESARLVLYYTRNPGADFLYQELKQCLVSIGRPIIPEIMTAIKEDLDKQPYYNDVDLLLGALGDLGDTQAVPFLSGLLDTNYHDEYIESDVKSKVLLSLGKLKASSAIDKIENELMHGRDEMIRQAAAQALAQIGGPRAFEILARRLKLSDSEWVERECFTGLYAIAFKDLNDDHLKNEVVELYISKRQYEYAFQIMLDPLADGEAWAVDHFFEILPKVSMTQHLFSVIGLLDSGNKKIFDQTLTFLNKLTRQKLKAAFTAPAEAKVKLKKAFFDWYQNNCETLN
jgi:HEAT repeat protein